MQCLVIMPFRAEFDLVFECVREAWASAELDEQVDCYWLKDRRGAGQITDEIVDGLGASTICVADVSENNPNVMWETGYAMALGRPVILIGQAIETIPFDLKDHRLLKYEPSKLHVLRDQLTKAIEQTVARFRKDHLRPRPAHLYWLGHDLARAIRFSMHEHFDRVELEKCLLFGIHHLDQIELPAAESRELLLQALARCRNLEPFADEEWKKVTGWIAQAKNDLGDAIAAHDMAFVPYPTAAHRKAITTEADQLRHKDDS